MKLEKMMFYNVFMLLYLCTVTLCITCVSVINNKLVTFGRLRYSFLLSVSWLGYVSSLYIVQGIATCTRMRIYPIVGHLITK